MFLGGSTGVGKKIAFELIKRGCSISVAAREPKKLEQAREELDSFAKSVCRNAKVHGFVLDGTHSYESTEAVVKEAIRHGGDIDILINHAGTSVEGEFDKLTLDQFESQMMINYFSTVYLTKAVLGRMKERGSGHIGFVASIGSQIPLWGYTAYCASKWALRGFAESLLVELLPYNIGVSITYPPATINEGYKVNLCYLNAHLTSCTKT
ncbi:unnamed protein product [Enterobius vermicularis]|uniref:3-ketodihydrosphingosine reductase n=1 Tax=Enterobius vermicularis TaxID=51028 RepID=A0A0N4VEB3_ENTVE|nr:unnamed protein product [Enterobius vermicularis]